MSTEDQKYSIPNQQDAIRRYAAEHGFHICRTYADPGRSGILIRNRDALTQLVGDTLSGTADFSAIIVYDVTRWGRFQNPDEAAHYEFICTNAGIPVHYCAEQFANDGSVQSSLMKAIKRAMAAEFSRELGVKVFDGMKRLVSQGFHAGALPPYGLERMMISASGKKKGILKRGDRKNFKNDKVVLVRGKRSEVEIVQKIFSMCANEHKNCPRIAKELNAARLKYRGQPWDFERVLRVIRCRQYLGLNVWGRRSLRLHGPNIQQPQSLWTISKAPFKPIIDQDTFDKARRTLAGYRRTPYTKEALVGHLRHLMAKGGNLTCRIIDKKTGPMSSVYVRHFGSLTEAYNEVHFTPSTRIATVNRHARSNRAMFNALVARLQELFPAEVRIIRRSRRVQKPTLEVDAKFRVSVLLCGPGCKVYRNAHRPWVLRVSPEAKNNIALVCLIDPKWEKVQNYYLLPPIGASVNRFRYLVPNDTLLASGKELTDLSTFCDAVRSVGEEIQP
jgi:DNA invertase Pin-like site-specific DNA recombinase